MPWLSSTTILPLALLLAPAFRMSGSRLTHSHQDKPSLSSPVSIFPRWTKCFHGASGHDRWHHLLDLLGWSFTCTGPESLWCLLQYGLPPCSPNTQVSQGPVLSAFQIANKESCFPLKLSRLFMASASALAAITKLPWAGWCEDSGSFSRGWGSKLRCQYDWFLMRPLILA